MPNNELYEKATIGYNHLLEFTKDRNPRHLQFIKENYEQIVDFMLLCYYQSNIEIVDIKNKKTLEDVFTMQNFERVNSGYSYEDSPYMEYGIGIITKNNDIPYETQVRFIRNALAHHSFTINEDGNFHIKTSNYEAYIDPKWLEALLFCVLSDTRSDFKKGMSESITFNFKSDKPLNPDEFKNYLAQGYICLIDITLDTNSKDKVKRVLGLKEDAPLEEFNDVYQLMKHIILHGLKDRINKNDSPNEHVIKIKQYLKELNKDLEGAITLTYRQLDYHDIEDLLNNRLFTKLSTYQEQVTHMYNHFITSRSEDIKNTLSYCCLKHVLFKIYNDEPLDTSDYLYLQEAKGFIAKAYGNLVVNNICRMNDYQENSYLITREFGKDLKIDFGHAKNFYKEVIKQLTSFLEDVKTYPSEQDMSSAIDSAKYLLNRYNKRLIQMSHGILPSLHIQLRNMLAHGYLKCHQDQIHLYDKAKDLNIPRYSKSKKKWSSKEITSPVIYNLEMSLDTYNEMLIALSHKYQIDPLKKPKHFKEDTNII